MACSAGPDVSESGLVLALDAADRYSFILTSVEVLVVAGGGGGGMDMGGGGGGGGVIYNPNVTVTPGSSVTVTVGAGGAGAPAAGTNGQPGGHAYTIGASNGENSVFGALTAIGGGAGGSSVYTYTPGAAGANGGSGGGASGYSNDGTTRSGGTGTAGQGFAGGGGGGPYYSGGGGGAGGAGVSSPNKPNGGPGVLYPSMSPYYFGGGGGGASYTLPVGGDGGVGGGGGGAVGTTYGGAGLNNGSPGGGGGNIQWANTPGGNAGANTGGGGGGGAHYNSNNKGGDGGSGIVIVRYPGPQRAIGGTVTTVGGHTIHTFTGSSTFTPLVATNNSTILGLSDLSNTGNFGTTVNSPIYSSANGGSINFDGINEYMTSTISNNPTTQITLESWIYPERAPSTGTIRGAAISGDPNHYLGILDSVDGGVTHSLHFALSTSTGRPGSQVGNIPRFAWSYIVGTYDGTRMKAYLNGTLVYDTALTGTISGSGNWTVGCYQPLPTDGTHNFDGLISSAKIYNRALTAAEIQQNFNSLRGRFGI